MAKSKKNRQADFQKVKLKVGKKLKKADNVTNTSFKSRTIQISQKLKSTDGAEPSTRKKQNISELLSQCRHYSTSVRHEAVTGLRELITSFPGLASSHLAVILEKSSELLTDKDAAVRQGVIRLFKAFLSNISEKQISPFFPLLCAHLCCAMTHIYDDIQVHSLSVLDLLLEHYPKLLISKSNQVLSNFIEQISQKQGQGQMKRSLATNPNSKTTSMKWRSSVLNRLDKFLTAILQFHSSPKGDTCNVETAPPLEVTMATGNMLSVQSFSKYLRQQWETPGFTISSSSVDLSSEQGDVVGGRFEDFASTLVPLMLECWIEAAPSQQMSSGAGNLVRAENVSVLANVLHVTQKLWECIAVLSTEQQQEQWQKGKYLKDFHHHLLANFPYSVHATLVKKDKKDKKQPEQVSAEELNLAVCDIMTHFISDIPAGKNTLHTSVWLPIITEYLRDFLNGKYGTNMIGQNCRTIVKILDRLLLAGTCEESLSDVIMIVFQRYKGANCMSQEKKTYLKFCSKIMVDSWKPTLVSSDIREMFLTSLPELLPLVARNNSQMATMLIDTMKKAACQKCAFFLQADIMSQKKKEWFDPAVGAMMSLSPWEQRNLLGLLYFMPDINAELMKTFTDLVRSDKLSETEAAFLIQVLHNRYLRLGQRSEDAAIHIGFLANLIIGLSKEEIKSNLDHPDSSVTPVKFRGGFKINHTQETEAEFGCRHQFIIQVVCSVINQSTNTEQIQAVMCNFIETFLTSNNMVPLQVGSGICSFVKSLPTACVPPTVASLLTSLASSVIFHLVTWEQSTNQNVVKEIQDLCCELILKLPGAMEQLLKEVLHQLQDARAVHLTFLVKTVLLFLNEGRSKSIKAKPGCLELLKSVSDVAKSFAQTEENEKEVHTSLEAVKVITEFEYLVSML